MNMTYVVLGVVVIVGVWAAWASWRSFQADDLGSVSSDWPHREVKR